MDKLTQMQALLPYLAELPHDEATESFWKAAESGNTWNAFCALLSLLPGEHRHRVYGMISALTGKGIRDILHQPFPAICRELMACLDQEALLFCHMVSACGVRTVARVLYQYRPPCALAIPELILMDRDNLKISMYACDMLRAIIGMFSEDASTIPTIRELLDPAASVNRKRITAAEANNFIDDMIRRFGKKEE